MERDGENISKWYKANFLEGNFSKYQAIMIGKYTPAISNLEIDKEIIKRTDKLKLLGVTIDERLNFSDHISATCRKTSKLIGVVMRLRKLIPTEAKL